MCSAGQEASGAVTLAGCVRFGLLAPDERGRVRWLFLWWRGLPLPLRVALVLEAVARRVDETGELPAFARVREKLALFDHCGCLDLPKRLVERLGRRARGRARGKG